MLQNLAHLAALLAVLSGLVYPSSGWSLYLPRRDCQKDLIAESESAAESDEVAASSRFEPADRQISYITQIQTGSDAERSQALEALYANYSKLINAMAVRHAYMLRSFVPSDPAQYVANFVQIGKMALAHAASKYQLSYPKPGRYIKRYVKFYMLEVVLTRDGRLKRNRLVHRKMTHVQRSLLFQGKLDELFESLGGKIKRKDLEDLHEMYTAREISMNTRVENHFSGSHRSDELIDFIAAKPPPGLVEKEREMTIVGLVRTATTRLKDSVRESDWRVIEARIFCDEEDAVPYRTLATELNLCKEGPRFTEQRMRQIFKSILQDLLVNQEDFIRGLPSKHAEVAKQRLFTVEKRMPIKNIAAKLNLSEGDVADIEGEVRENYENLVRERLADLLESEPTPEYYSPALNMLFAASGDD